MIFYGLKHIQSRRKSKFEGVNFELRRSSDLGITHREKKTVLTTKTNTTTRFEIG